MIELSPDLLEGHRQRFLKVFRELSQLYEKTMSLQYFKNLIAIQLLPKVSPITSTNEQRADMHLHR